MVKIKNIPKYVKKYIDLAMYNSKKSNNLSEVYVLDTSLNSDNLGDNIINFYSNKVFKELGISIVDRIPTHVVPKKESINGIIPKIVTGTNILSSKMEAPYLWMISKNLNTVNNTLLLGNGWEKYYNFETPYTRMFYKKMLNNDFIHSVRDEYSKKKLNKLGIKNVVNTSCPTTWGLTPELCKQIPKGKGRKVVTTITDYSQDKTMDWYMLDTLLENYEEVFIWIQGERDLEYLKQYNNFSKLNLVERTLDAYNKILKLENLDFVGTRLHAGIHALNNKHRSIIVSIDNRAREMGKDINLPIVERNELKSKLTEMINNDFQIEINLPTKNIELWKKQFHK